MSHSLTWQYFPSQCRGEVPVWQCASVPVWHYGSPGEEWWQFLVLKWDCELQLPPARHVRGSELGWPAVCQGNILDYRQVVLGSAGQGYISVWHDVVTGWDTNTNNHNSNSHSYSYLYCIYLKFHHPESLHSSPGPHWNIYKPHFALINLVRRQLESVGAWMGLKLHF